MAILLDPHFSEELLARWTVFVLPRTSGPKDSPVFQDRLNRLTLGPSSIHLQQISFFLRSPSPFAGVVTLVSWPVTSIFEEFPCRS